MSLLQFHQISKQIKSGNLIMSNRFSVSLLLLCMILAACSSTPGQEEVATATPPTMPTPDITDTNSPTQALISSELDSQQLLDMLSNGDENNALISIVEQGDQQFISVLIELMRAAQIGLLREVNYPALVEALEELSGQKFGDSWPAWVEWYGGTDLQPPPGFTTWKGELFARIDPQFADFLKDEHPARLRVEEIQWGGVLVDGIPALDNPEMIPAGQATYILDDEPVFGIALNGDARAYPLRIMDWHEMANDVIGGVPVSLAYCTLCGAGIAFDGRAADGNTYTFGSSGFLYRSNKLMYDRETRTLWNQLSGEPVLGDLAGTDLRLPILPIVLTSWSDWVDQHPETEVLSLETGYQRPYEIGAAYGDYFSYEDTMFPVWQRSDELGTKDRVYALYIEGVPKAYSLDKLVEEQVVNDRLGKTPLVLVAQRGIVEVEGVNRRVGPVTYGSGGEVRAYERGEHNFEPGPESDTIFDEQGNSWMVTEDALIGPDGEKLPRLGGHLAYWFGWYAFFPNTLIYK
jgi:hypothetical protein